jgi:hypothetical protein
MIPCTLAAPATFRTVLSCWKSGRSFAGAPYISTWSTHRRAVLFPAQFILAYEHICLSQFVVSLNFFIKPLLLSVILTSFHFPNRSVTSKSIKIYYNYVQYCLLWMHIWYSRYSGRYFCSRFQVIIILADILLLLFILEALATKCRSERQVPWFILLLFCHHSTFIVHYTSCINYDIFRPFLWLSSGIYSFPYIHLFLWSAIPPYIGQRLQNGSVYFQFYVCVNSPCIEGALHKI